MKSKDIAPRLAVATALMASAGAAYAAPVAAPGYSVSLFAAGPAGTSKVDSVEVVGNKVYVGYGNGGAPDGSGGAISTIAEFSSAGQLLNSTSIVGHNDGLRYDAATHQIWALQNEDASANLVLVNPGTLSKSAPIAIGSVNPGPGNGNAGGFDDVLFQGGKAFISASNPGKNPNTDPAIVSATLSGGPPASVATTPALMGNASATLLNTGADVTLNLQDPDSLSQTVDGRAVMTSQGDGQLVFVSNLGKSGQTVSVLQLNSALANDVVNVDDTAFGGTAKMSLLVADKTTNAIYKITGDFNPNWGYSAAQTLDANGNAVNGFIGAFDATSAQTLGATNGLLSPIVTGLGNPGGEGFLAAVPEPSTWALFLVGFGALGLFSARRARTGGAAVSA